jgi:glycosyltransferase involved in cell wall biosynthesis
MDDRDNSIPLVSICCVTYNHEKFIAQCLDGFVMQKTDFSFEILVHEDASTDRTAQIVKEYEAKYPHLFRCVYQTENQFLKQNTLINILMPMARGQYIALCEGDDYWTDPLKLQTQVKYLEQNQNVSICIHNGNIEENGIIVGKSRGDSFKVYSLKNVVKSRVLAPTASYLFRNSFKFPSWFTKVYGGDSAFLFLLAQIGEIHYLPYVMCVYRRNPTSVEGYYKNKSLDKAQRDINDSKVYLSIVPNEYKEIVLKRIIWNYFYRVAKGIQLLNAKSFASDFSLMIKYSSLLAIYWLRNFARYLLK